MAPEEKPAPEEAGRKKEAVVDAGAAGNPAEGAGGDEAGTIEEGGEVKGIGDNAPSPIEIHDSKAAKGIAQALLWILGVSVGVHYFLTFLLLAVSGPETAQVLNDVFDVWLPAIIGLVSGATSYYFAKSKS